MDKRPGKNASTDPPCGQHRRNSFSLQAGDENLFPLLSDIHVQILSQRASMEEMAESLHLPIGTVKSRLYRARTALEMLRKERDASTAAH